MALTPEERQQVIQMLEQEDKYSLRRILASLKSFLEWLKLALSLIYLVVKKSDFGEKLFNFISRFF
ncbi:hypothetical protein [Microcystis aeruginosa]|jgi:hypothetical protein|uniref:Uncharacterized protein n=5 Tax=Microcystis aeruginosa TaxID=1126 RepID=A0A6H9GCD2_MICAE|nr:hypothetical protein [Microcystis aeruginosa]MCZ8129606.1 hypothetical protein [Microcystis sp. LE19-114.1B]NCR98721.1 hypothetical protein [Microcystis aeruginosa L311-01]OCY15635.1 MAG: hypothetical protein BEV12_14115 [Microcystis aeruginosa CACIAM 03]TRU12629.1 MAG: hypothetical protein EWV59_08290 [Microcystis aeruginosa Ma_MB_F_20061100_S19D]TRU19065.1 MAG: hypothetical protein EWV58_00315 [Microcystis aeruginosa Ma_MB_F_20061100_S19]